MEQTYILNKAHAATYSRFRSARPPEKLLDAILQYTQEKISPPWDYAVDVGCGTGQGTLHLSPHFKNVLGLDPSEEQVEEARKTALHLSNVTFQTSFAEELPMKDSSVQLLTASQSFHWFEADKFFSEARRVLVPNGVLAIYSYIIPLPSTGDATQDQKLTEQVMKIYKGPELSQFSSSHMHCNDQKYDTVKLPFADEKRMKGIMKPITVSVADYANYIQTWSSFQKFIHAAGEKAGKSLLTSFTKGMTDILQTSEDAELQFEIEYFMLLGRNNP